MIAKLWTGVSRAAAKLGVQVARERIRRDVRSAAVSSDPGGSLVAQAHSSRATVSRMAPHRRASRAAASQPGGTSGPARPAPPPRPRRALARVAGRGLVTPAPLSRILVQIAASCHHPAHAP